MATKHKQKAKVVATKIVNTKQLQFKLKRKYWVPGLIVLLLIALFFERGWIRVTVIPKTVGALYVHGVQTTLSDQNKVLRYPYATLGFATMPPVKTSCALQQAQSIHTEIYCSSVLTAYTKLAGTTAEQAKAKELQTLLKTNGWQSGGNGVTLTRLIDDTAHGIDWSPDAFYEKIVNGDDCIFDTFIAYANPQPPAIRTVFSCDRTANVLGTPRHEYYTSAKGNL